MITLELVWETGDEGGDGLDTVIGCCTVGTVEAIVVGGSPVFEYGSSSSTSSWSDSTIKLPTGLFIDVSTNRLVGGGLGSTSLLSSACTILLIQFVILPLHFL